MGCGGELRPEGSGGLKDCEGKGANLGQAQLGAGGGVKGQVEPPGAVRGGKQKFWLEGGYSGKPVVGAEKEALRKARRVVRRGGICWALVSESRSWFVWTDFQRPK